MVPTNAVFSFVFANNEHKCPLNNFSYIVPFVFALPVKWCDFYDKVKLKSKPVKSPVVLQRLHNCHLETFEYKNMLYFFRSDNAILSGTLTFPGSIVFPIF